MTTDGRQSLAAIFISDKTNTQFKTKRTESLQLFSIQEYLLFLDERLTILRYCIEKIFIQNFGTIVQCVN